MIGSRLGRTVLLEVRVLSLVILLNFIAQVPYYLHLYYNPNQLVPANIGGILSMASVFALFLAGYLLLLRGRTPGYWLLALFLLMEFAFYLWNTVGSVVHGYAPFYHLGNPDPILRGVFAIGYLNLFASGYFLFLLLQKRRLFLAS